MDGDNTCDPMYGIFSGMRVGGRLERQKQGIALSSVDVHARFSLEVNHMFTSVSGVSLSPLPFVFIARPTQTVAVTMECHENMHQAEGGVAVW